MGLNPSLLTRHHAPFLVPRLKPGNEENENRFNERLNHSMEDLER